MAKQYPRLVRLGDKTGPSTPPPPPSEDPREVFRLRVLEDLEEERTLLYRFICVGEAISLALILRSLMIHLLQG